MRNRGVEICVLPARIASRDTLLLLTKIGVPPQLADAMAAFHTGLAEADAAGRGGLMSGGGSGVSKWTLRDILQVRTIFS